MASRATVPLSTRRRKRTASQIANEEHEKKVAQEDAQQEEFISMFPDSPPRSSYSNDEHLENLRKKSAETKRKLEEVRARQRQPSSSSSSTTSSTPLRSNSFVRTPANSMSPSLGRNSPISLASNLAGVPSSSQTSPSPSVRYSSGIASSSNPSSFHQAPPLRPPTPTSSSSSRPPTPIFGDAAHNEALIKQYIQEVDTRKKENQLEDFRKWIAQRNLEVKQEDERVKSNLANPIASTELGKVAVSTPSNAPTATAVGGVSSSIGGGPGSHVGEPKEAEKEEEGAGSEKSHHGGGEPNNSGSNSGETYSSSSSSSSGGAPQAGAGTPSGAPTGGGEGGGGGNGMAGGLPKPAGDVGDKNKPGRTGPPPPPGITPPPPVNENTQGQGDYHPPPYGDGSNFAEKARESDSDRTNPITPATGSKQTASTANSLVGAGPIMASAEKQSPEKVYGTAEERANMGKGRPSPWEYNGPFDFPSRAGGSLNTSLTAVGAWRSKTGEHASSVWRSQLTARGEPAKRDSFYKWSSKGGGNWRQLSGSDAMHVFSKMDAKRNGARWLSRPNPGQQLTHLMGATLKRKMEDINMGKKGNERMNKRKKGADPAAPGVVQM